MMSIYPSTMKLHHYRRILIGSAFILHFYNNVAYRLMDSFIPSFADSVDVNPFQVGLIFAAFCISLALFSPLWSELCNKIGYKPVIIMGLTIEAVILIILTVTDDLSGPKFTTVLFILRFAEGIASAATQTGCYIMISVESGDDAGSGFGFIEMFGGLGQMVGPLVGGWLFEDYGYDMPFYVIGITGFILAFSVFVSLPRRRQLATAIDIQFIQQHSSRTVIKEKRSSSRAHLPASVRAYMGMNQQSREAQQSEQNVSYADVLSIGAVSLACIFALCATSMLAFLEPTLEPHLVSTFNLSKVQIGAVFAVGSFTQTIMSPIAGSLSDKKNPKIYMIAGLTLTTLALFLVGPTVIFPFLPTTLSLQILSIALLGASVSLCVVSTFAEQMRAISHLGLTANARVAGLSASILAAGEAAGALLGSSFVHALSFPWASTLLAFLAIFVLSVTATLIKCGNLAWDSQVGKSQFSRVEEHSSEEMIQMNNPSSDEFSYHVKSPILERRHSSSIYIDAHDVEEDFNDKHFLNDDEDPITVYAPKSPNSTSSSTSNPRTQLQPQPDSSSSTIEHNPAQSPFILAGIDDDIEDIDLNFDDVDDVDYL